MVSYEAAHVRRIDAAPRHGARVPACATASAGGWVATATSGFTLVELLVAIAIILTLFGVSAPAYTRALDAAKVTRAVGDIRALSADVLGHMLTFGELPAELVDVDKGELRDPWGNPYQYLNFAAASGGGGGGGGKGKGKGGGPPPAGARKDKFLVPINSLYDLYSMGKDGQSVPPLPAKPSRDDVVMAADGAFVGLAVDF